jgi:hypothetical protein
MFTYSNTDDVLEAIGDLESDIGEERMKLLDELNNEEQFTRRCDEIRHLLIVLDAHSDEDDSCGMYRRLLHLHSVYDELPPGASLLADGQVFDSHLDDAVDEFIPRGFPDWIVIDWESTRDNLRSDYTRVEIDGDTYWYRE